MKRIRRSANHFIDYVVADSPTDIVSHYGPVAGESEPRAAAAKVRSEHDRAFPRS